EGRQIAGARTALAALWMILEPLSDHRTTRQRAICGIQPQLDPAHGILHQRADAELAEEDCRGPTHSALPCASRWSIDGRSSRSHPASRSSRSQIADSITWPRVSIACAASLCMIAATTSGVMAWERKDG